MGMDTLVVCLKTPNIRPALTNPMPASSVIAIPLQRFEPVKPETVRCSQSGHASKARNCGLLKPGRKTSTQVSHNQNPQLFMVGIVPYYPSLTRVLIVAQVPYHLKNNTLKGFAFWSPDLTLADTKAGTKV